jgi:hypothetical protein
VEASVAGLADDRSVRRLQLCQRNDDPGESVVDAPLNLHVMRDGGPRVVGAAHLARIVMDIEASDRAERSVFDRRYCGFLRDAKARLLRCPK